MQAIYTVNIYKWSIHDGFGPIETKRFTNLTKAKAYCKTIISGTTITDITGNILYSRDVGCSNLSATGGKKSWKV